MGLFDDFSQFLESQLNDYLKSNPQLELQILLAEIAEQKQSTLKLIDDLKQQDKRLQDELFSLAQDLQKWLERTKKAEQANRSDLAKAAEERVTSLRGSGNQLWAKMTDTKNRLVKAEALLHQIQDKEKEIKSTQTNSYSQSPNPDYSSPSQSKNVNLDEEFERWEMDQELDKMKKDLGF